jgi:hypothetical protein
MNTIGEVVSRLRNSIKAVKEDAFITDRYLYSMTLKYAKALMRRQDNEGKIIKLSNLYEKLPYVELEEVNKIDACCSGIKTDCTIMRTKDKLPPIVDGSDGPLIRMVSTIDDSIIFNPTYLPTFVSIANTPNYKYNKTKYYWYQEQRLYFPNVMYDAVNIYAIWESSISYLKCEDEAMCTLRQNDVAPIPDYLYAEIEKLIQQDLSIVMQLPVETQDDKQSIQRT